ncbi:glycoside hydrolase family 16 protein [Amanita thiersii Skay4041]|uniref:Glycoside hydrolase family 16 protein n=1 Tax=Amanita thiersii Skay4041 TaxID=703135 RepID=A0A2A9NYS8_9AGAR|nr:glycoside hydrolase family 16 protein [Amanita thiersii Skay4041]
MARLGIVLALLCKAVVHAATIQERQSCDTYVVPGITGGFTQHTFADFSGVTPGESAASLLSSHGISIDTGLIGTTPIPHQFVAQNVLLGSGSVDLKVNAYNPSSGQVVSAEMATTDQFLYASVRTVLKSSGVPGVVEGNFMYHNDNQETDFEILTSTVFSSSQCVAAGIWTTNQPLQQGGTSTHNTIPFTFNPASGFHAHSYSLHEYIPEYRIDWSSNSTTFYIDGVQVSRLTTNVPTQAGPWLWNAWSSGDPCWSNGPPTADSFTHIRSIEIYKGYTSTASGTICQV